MSVRLYIWQRSTAALMLPLILIHLAFIFHATSKGLKAADILCTNTRKRRMGFILRRLRDGRGDPIRDRHPKHFDRADESFLEPRKPSRSQPGVAVLALGFRAIAAVVLHG